MSISPALVDMSTFTRLWAYRGFVFGSVRREFQSKYLNSLLGAAWAVVNPLSMIVVYTVIFSQVMRARLPGSDHDFAYSIYLCSGLLTWNFFAEVVVRSQNIFLDNANLIKKISFPRLCLPLVATLNASVNFFIIFVLFLGFLALSDFWPGWPVVAALPVLTIQLIFAIGLGSTLGILNVFFRDVGQFFNIFLQFWFWFTPVIYPVTILPERLQTFAALNPMYAIVNAYHGIFVSGSLPIWGTLAYPLVIGGVLCGLCVHLFRRHAGELVDEL